MAIEFAFVAPVLLALLAALVDFSFIYYTFNSAQQAGWQVARQVATGKVAAADAAALVRGKLPTWAQGGAVVPTVALSNSVYTVTVSLKLADATPIHFMNALYGANTLTTTASFQSEVN